MPAPAGGPLPEAAQVVIVGGGVVGCSVAYHLTKLGVADVLLLERRALTCGTTWHAAGLVPSLRATYTLSMLAHYSAQLYGDLERETGQATGFTRNGSLTIATTAERWRELKRGASMAKVAGFECRLVTPEEIQALWPLANVADVVGGIYLPEDGVVSPVDLTRALAKGARQGGATVREGVEVLDVLVESGRAVGVVTAQGAVRADCVVNCAGMWARDFARKAGVSVPLHAAEHYYVVTEAVPGVTPGLPTLRDVDGYSYYKPEGGKLLIGQFEPEAKPWGMAGIPEDFEFGQLAFDYDHMAPYLETMLTRVPALQETGIQLFFCGPESFTPDDRYHLGEAPKLHNYFVTAGFNSVGIQSTDNAGKMLTDWIAHNYPPINL